MIIAIEGELHVDWVALQRLKHLGLLEERPAGFKLTQAGRDALRRLVLRVLEYSMLIRTPDRWVRPKRRQPPGFIVPCQPMIADKVPASDGSCNKQTRQ